MDEYSNKHYVKLRDDNAIIGYFSDAFQQPDADSVLIPGIGYQFRLWPLEIESDLVKNPENPNIWTPEGIPMYKWDGSKVVKRSDAEIQADITKIPPPMPIPPSDTELMLMEALAGQYEDGLAKDARIDALGNDVSTLKNQNLDIMMAVTDIYEMTLGGAV